VRGVGKTELSSEVDFRLSRGGDGAVPAHAQGFRSLGQRRNLGELEIGDTVIALQGMILGIAGLVYWF
jgi:hypothetical protein